MMGFQVSLKFAVALLSCIILVGIAASAADANATLLDVRVDARDGTPQIDVVLDRPVKPTVGSATGPDRLILIFPGVAPQNGNRRIEVGAGGVRSVRVEVYTTSPLETRVIVELDQMQPYSLAADGSKITLSLNSSQPQTGKTGGVPAAGKVSPIVGIFTRRKTQETPQQQQVESPADARLRAQAWPPAPPSSTEATPQQKQTPDVSSPPPVAVATAAPTVQAVPPQPVPAETPSVTAPTATPALAPTIQPAEVQPTPQTTVAVAQPAPKPLAPTNTAPVPTLTVRNSDLRTVFKVKYVADGAAYLDGGRSSGLSEGMKLQVLEGGQITATGYTGSGDNKVVAELEVTALADTSAVTDIKSPSRPVKPGDLAYLSEADQALLVQQRALSATRKYPQVITFTEGDPLEEEVRAEVPRPPLPEVNRARGRIGFDYGGIAARDGSGLNSTNVGLVLRTDVTRIGGSYWNLSGYWRGRLNSTASNFQPTLQDLINRTYHISMTYDNPNSAWVAGFGRLYLPWAPSLDTIDGGYFGRKLAKGITAGMFGGSTPDPTSWSYTPGRRLAGVFVNFEGGSYEDFHYTTTMGGAASTVEGQFDRPLVFFENGFSYKRYLTIYHSLQADNPPGNSATPSTGAGLARSFLTVRIQPHERISFDINHNYFRDIPTFDPQLVGTGLLDKYLFQGFSFGVRAEVIRKVTLYTTVGRNTRSGDPTSSLNTLYGAAFDRIWKTGLRADVHYSKFTSSFGNGSYEAVSLSRSFSERYRIEVLAGEQRFVTSSLTNESSRFVTSMVDIDLGARFFFNGGFTAQRGALQSYDQWFTTLGYRFDNRNSRK